MSLWSISSCHSLLLKFRLWHTLLNSQKTRVFCVARSSPCGANFILCVWKPLCFRTSWCHYEIKIRFLDRGFMKGLLWRRFGGALQTKISSKSLFQILDFPEKNYQHFHDLKCRPLFTTFPCPDPFNSFPSGFTTWNNPRAKKKINFSKSVP